MFNAQDLQINNSEVNNVGRDQHITKIFVTEEKALALLKPVVRNVYVPRCMDGTRESVFKEIDDWLNGPDSDSTPNIMWINGSPGAGKSAIASSLVSILTEKRRLGSYFFFKRGDANLGDPASLWRTVASDLAQFHPSMKACVVEFLNQPGFRESDIHLHFKCLIADVLTKCSGELCSRSPVVVVDALDECGLDDSHSSQRQILLGTLTSWTRLPRSFKLLITSRDDRVPISFQDPLLCHKITLETGDSVSKETQNDIRVFFEQSFDHIRPTLGLPLAWPGKLTIDQLTKRAAGLFIWAKTAMAFIGEKRGKPKARLQLVLSGNLGTKTDNIDMLYRNILRFSFDDSDDDTLHLFRMVLGTIIVAKVPFHRDDLKYFLRVLGREDDEDDWEIDAILYSLSSVIDLDTLLRFKHLSFIEFLSDPSRCRERHFVIDQSEHHQRMAFSCLRVLNTELRFNISGLTSSYERNEDVECLPKRIPAHVAYASLYWADHFTVSPSPKDLLNGIENFLHDKFLFWLEVLSVLAKSSSGSTILMKMVTSSNGISHLPPSVARFVKEANKFAIAFREPISYSAPHIYLSALSFSREGGMVKEAFKNHFPSVLSVEATTERRKQYPILVLNGRLGSVRSVAFSPDNKKIVSCSDNPTIRIWDAVTGEDVLKPLEGHSNWVTSVAFSPYGKRIVSGSHDRTVCVWDVETGEAVLKPFEGHKGIVTSVAFSPDGRCIVSGSHDKTIRIWNAETGEAVLKPLEGHSGVVVSVAFSPDGKRLVSGSRDGTILVWDAETGEVVFKLLESSRDIIESVAFSPDGKRIISGSSDRMVRVWDVKTGEAVLKPLVGHTGWVTSVTFSPDGKHVVSGSHDHTIRIWDAEIGEAVFQPLEGHKGGVTSVAFSPNGRRIISASNDQTICVWDTEFVEPVLKPLGHTRAVTSITFSPDGKWIASGSVDHTIRIWDAETGEELLKPLVGHTDSVFSVSFSPNGKNIVSGSRDCTIRLWDAQTGMAVSNALVGHTASVLSVAFSPDGKNIVSGSYDCTVRVWDTETRGAAVKIFESRHGLVISVAFSPNGKHIVSGSDLGVQVWDAETGEVLKPLEGKPTAIKSVAFSPNGKRILSGSGDRTIRVWDAETGEAVLKLLAERAVVSVAFSPNGKQIASSSYDQKICVWDAETGTTVLKLEGHTELVVSVAFSPDGKSVASASHDCTIRLWDIESVSSSPTLPQMQSHNNLANSTMIDNRILPAFSSNPNHAFSIHDLLQDDVETDPRNAFKIQDGWILGPRNELLFWVPHEHRRELWWPRTKAIIGAPMAHIDLSRMVHGPSWTKCYFA